MRGCPSASPLEKVKAMQTNNPYIIKNKHTKKTDTNESVSVFLCCAVKIGAKVACFMMLYYNVDNI